ncbi:MAG TPA: hypothetical protein VH599_04245 [Ktedonobacterales bacterium]
MPTTIASFLGQLRNAAQTLEEPELLDLIAAVQEHTSQSALRILIVGLTGSGRCSLTNALIGQPTLLPASPIPKAPIPIEIGYGETLSVELYGKDGGTTALPPENLRAFLTSPDTHADQYRSLEVRTPADLLKTTRFRLESIGAARAAAEWKELLTGTDYVFLTLKAVALLSEEERAFVREILHSTFGLERVTLVINQIDLIEKEEQPELVERARTFLGPFESQPAIISFSAAHINRGKDTEASGIDSGYEAIMRLVRNDLAEHHQALHITSLHQGAALCLATLEEAATRQQALLMTNEADLKDLLSKIETQQQWLPSRVERVQQRIETFINTMLKAQFLREIEGFSAALQQQLPGEVASTQDIATLKRYLPGYIEALWTEFFTSQLDAVRSQLATEMKLVNHLIEEDFRELLEGQRATLQEGTGEFDPTPARIKTLLMPRRGKHAMGQVATGVQVAGLILLIPPLGSLPLGLAAIGIGQAIRMIFKKQTDAADRQAIIASAVKAIQELEGQIKKQVAARFDSITQEVKQAAADRYVQELARIQQALEESLAWRQNLSTKQEQLTSLLEKTIPALRGILNQLQDAEGTA